MSGTSTVAGLLAQALARLSDSDTARIDAQLLLASVLGKSRSWLYAWPEAVPDDSQRERFLTLVEARRAGSPVAYLLGEREFYGLLLRVDESVLIPRPDSELLVETTLALDLPSEARVADLGTGSGAIALALASVRPHWQLLAADISSAALAVARDNASRLDLERVQFVESAWCAALPPGPYDAIVSNPPYLAADDVHLQQGDLRFEPRSALVAGPDGLEDLRLLAAQCRPLLRSGAALLLEHGWQQGEQVRQILAAAGYCAVCSYRDLAGHERVTGGLRP